MKESLRILQMYGHGQLWAYIHTSCNVWKIPIFIFLLVDSLNAFLGGNPTYAHQEWWREKRKYSGGYKKEILELRDSGL